MHTSFIINTTFPSISNITTSRWGGRCYNLFTWRRWLSISNIQKLIYFSSRAITKGGRWNNGRSRIAICIKIIIIFYIKSKTYFRIPCRINRNTSLIYQYAINIIKRKYCTTLSNKIFTTNYTLAYCINKNISFYINLNASISSSSIIMPKTISSTSSKVASTTNYQFWTWRKYNGNRK